jgi:hypothetical protein
MDSSVKNLIAKSIAVSSGKGGVGKTTTAVNLALYYAKKNLRTGLVDLDPLSDIETLLDLKESEHIIKENEFSGKNGNLKAHVHKVFLNFDILFPRSKLGKADMTVLKKMLYSEYAAELSEAYDVIIFDMPAGIREEDNLAFLPYFGSLVLVTNSEPSAHVSAGGYLKAVLERKPGLPVFFWHNKYERNPGAGFDPDDVIGNFNKNSAPEDRIVVKKAYRIEHLAHIPLDASLDLLQTDSSVSLNIQRSLIDTIEFIKEERLHEFALASGVPAKTFELIKYFLIHRPESDSNARFIDDLGNYVGNIVRYRMGKEVAHKRTGKEIPEGRKIFLPEHLSALDKLFAKMNADPLRKRLLRVLRLVDESLREQEKSRRRFFVGNTTPPNKMIDIEISRLLVTLNNSITYLPKTVQYASGLLLFYFSLYKLFRSPTLLTLVSKFTPIRKNSKGLVVRDKYRQIKNLVEKDKLYAKRYFHLIKLLFPVVSKQVFTIAKTFNLANIYFKNKDKTFNKEAYAKLFSHFIHDCVNSGLGIITGFRYRPASVAFQDSADKLLAKMSK